VTTTRHRTFHLSLSGLSIAFALGLALWEWYFFFIVSPPPVENVAARLGVFTPTRLGFHLAWLVVIYLTYQLLSIPFALPATSGRFIGVVDGMASLLPLAVVLVVVFGGYAFKSECIRFVHMPPGTAHDLCLRVGVCVLMSCTSI